jgi:hypothetical protein
MSVGQIQQSQRPTGPSGWGAVRAAWGLALLLLITFNVAHGQVIPLWTVVSYDNCPADRLSYAVSQCAVVRVRPDALTAASAELRLALPDRSSETAMRKLREHVAGTAFIWNGSIDGRAFSRVTFSLLEHTVVGNIAFDGKMFRLRTISGTDVVEQLNMSLLPQDSEPADYHLETTSVPDTECNTDDPNQIDLLVLYTPAARSGAYGEVNIRDWIALQVFEADQTFRLSEASPRLNLVGTRMIEYAETGNNFDSLKRLTRPNDEFMDEAHTWRNDYNADVVMLITYTAAAGTSGMANPMRDYHVPDVNGDFISFEPLAFAVLDTGSFMTAELTLAHELGHILGAQHNADARDAVTTGAIPDSSYGFMGETPTAPCTAWMTIMSIRESGDRASPGKCEACNRLSLWSNDESSWSTEDPSISTCGDPAGNEQADNRKTVNLTAKIVSAFRCGTALQTPAIAEPQHRASTDTTAVDAYYTMSIDGGADGDAQARLRIFHQRLMAELKVNDLGYANVGCDSCSKLGEVGPPLRSLTFVMEPDSRTLAAFASTYHYVQQQLPNEQFSLTIDGTSLAAAAGCPMPLPAGCRPRPICVHTGGCDRPYGGSCSPCF